jgi:hypothetical protein
LIPEQHILFGCPVQGTDAHVKVNLYIGLPYVRD